VASGAVNDVDAPPRGRLFRIFGVVALLVAFDVLTKVWAVSALSDGPVHVIGDSVEFRLGRNPGGAFGQFQGMTPLLAIGAIVVSVLLVREARRSRDRLKSLGYVLVLAGAFGNLVDRIFRAPGFLRGHVVDFVSVGWFPVFNVADSCITIGAILLIWRSLRAPVE